ncbi:MAG: hypothetical protein IT449_02205 [Phycisphaerales bacterium]|nr:hypothetical protein [Phycisphaerales bacterium]
MSTWHARRARGSFLGLSAAFALGTAWIWPASALLPEGDPVLRVEEDWELVLNEPDGETASPQFATVMSPHSDMNSYYAQTLWNYRETPDFVLGGIQLHSYRGAYLIRTRSVEYRVLSSSAETILWTQALETNGVTLTYSVFDGTSTTWGTFGRDMNISSSAGVSDLSGYDPAFSAANACVTFGSNRVDSLVLKRVRYYGRDGLLYTDETPRDACQ